MSMREDEYARQLRKPEGATGVDVARRMNLLNNLLYMHCFQLLPQKSQHLLEIGPGNAIAAASLLEERPEISYTGIDHAPDMVAEGIAQLDRFGDRASYLQGNAELLPFSEAHFDVLLSINTLFFVNQAEEAVREWVRVLKPGGLICIGLRSKESMEDLGLHKHGFRLFEPHAICTMLEQNGVSANNTITIREPDREINGLVKPMHSFICKGQKAE